MNSDKTHIDLTLSIPTIIVILPFLRRVADLRKSSVEAYKSSTPPEYIDENWIEQEEKIIEMIEDDIRRMSV